MDHRLSRIEMLCNAYLFNWDHISRRDETERIIKELHEATAPESLPLGVQISDGLATDDKVGD